MTCASTRDSAINMAQELMAGEKATGVKVVKETYNDETGDYLTLKIFEDGHNQMKVAAERRKTRRMPCPASSRTIFIPITRAPPSARLLADFLSRNKITITELIHRADMLEKLEATGTLISTPSRKSRWRRPPPPPRRCSRSSRA